MTAENTVVSPVDKGGHSRLSPSARSRWQLCPGSVAACATYEGGKSGPSAIDGTRTHTLLEKAIRESVQSVVDLVNTYVTDEYGTYLVDEKRFDRIKLAIDYINSRIRSHSGSAIFVHAEKRVNPATLVGRDDMSGTVDVQIISGDMIEIIDYKDGTIEVEADGNPQMEQYAIGALSNALMLGQEFKTVRMTIIQPKLAEFGKEPFTFAEYPIEKFMKGVLPRMIDEANATDDPDAKLVPGEKQCRFCAHKANCSAHISKAFADAGITFNPVHDKALPEVLKVPAPDMDDWLLKSLVTGAPQLRKLLDAVEDEALRRFEMGAPIDGLKVVRGPGRRAWAMPDEQVASLLSKMGVPKGSLYKTSVITAPNVEKLKWTKRDGTEKQLTERQLKIIKDEMISKGDGKLTVVPLSDKREPVEYGRVETMFKAVESPAQPSLPSWL